MKIQHQLELVKAQPRRGGIPGASLQTPTLQRRMDAARYVPVAFYVADVIVVAVVAGKGEEAVARIEGALDA